MNTLPPPLPVPVAAHRPGRLTLLVAAAMVAWAAPVRLDGADVGVCCPPAFPDAVHVREGCFVSSLAYVARFCREHPDERAQLLTVHPVNFNGPHTIALLSWRGQWWGRDEYSGVFPLRCEVRRDLDLARLASRADAALRSVASRHLREGRIHGADLGPRRLGVPEREADVARAAGLLPVASTVVRVRCGREDLPFLFFQPESGRIAVYDPAIGTAAADCTPTDIPALVRQVVRRLGYVPSELPAHGPALARN